MRFVNQGLSLWYATPDAPAPEGAVPAGAEEFVTVGLSPPDGSNWVDVHYRINGKPVNTVPASWFRNDHARGTQYFTARLPPFEPGDEVEFWATAACAGRYVPAPDARTAVMRLRVEESAIDVVNAASMRPTSPQSEMARSSADVAQGGRMAGESFFVPSTAWLVKKVTVLEPSFLPGEVGPTWIGPRGVKDLVIAAEPVLILLYLAGYEVPEIAIGNSTTDWVSFHPTDLRIRLGSGSWFDHVGSAHPGTGTQLLAVRATPMAHQQRRVDSAQPVPIPIPMTVEGLASGTKSATISAEGGGWMVVNASPVVYEASVMGVRDQILRYVITALTTFQSAKSVTEPPGLVGMYDPVNWRAVAFTSTGDPAVDLVATLRRVTLRLTGIRPQFGGVGMTGGWLQNDDDPDTHPTLTEERARVFLDNEIPFARWRCSVTDCLCSAPSCSRDLTAVRSSPPPLTWQANQTWTTGLTRWLESAPTSVS